MKKLLLPIALCFLMMSQNAFAQSRPVKGQVLDEKGQPVPGASIQIKGTTAGTITDANGNFSLEVPDEDNTLVISSLGYKPQEVDAGDGLNALTIHVETSANILGETVVIGYGTETRNTLIGGASTVDAKAFTDKPVASFTNMLQGKAPGVQVTGQNGAPGAEAFIRIRGYGSITGGVEPLVVIDGVPSTAAAYNAINPNDIDNVSILKDASTTAIYGSRGSNGVIMVTTKKGRGAPKISYGFQYGFKQKTPDNFDMMDFNQKLQYEKDVDYTNEYLAPLLAADGYASINDAPNPQKYWNMLRPYETDWSKVLLRKGRFSQHDLSFSGATDKMDYYFSLQAYNEDGISYGSDFDRKSGSATVNYRANDWLKIGENFRVSYSKQNVLRDIFNAQNPFVGMYVYNPYESPYDFSAAGVNGYNLTSQGFNVVEGIQNQPSYDGTLDGLSTTYLEVNPIKEVTIRSQLGLHYTEATSEYFLKRGSILDGYVWGDPTGSEQDAGSYLFNYVWTNTAQYKKTFNDVHNFTALAGVEFTKEHYKSYELESKGYPPFEGLTTQDNGSTPTTATTFKSDWALFSMFARVQYDYAGKYLANISFRRDGSSRFGNDVKYGNFVAGGLAWNMHTEDFMKDVSFVNQLKLWASVGTSGNDQIGNYDHIALYRVDPYNGQPTLYPSQVGNESLTWEKNSNYSVGVDFTLFNNRLMGSIDYYNRYTYDLLLAKPLSPTTGFPNQPSNIGNMRNSGMELMLNYDIIKTKDWLWSVGGNLTLNKNRITKLTGGASQLASKNSFNTYWKVGEPIEVYHMQKYAGIDPATGDELWYKQDGTTTNDYDEAYVFILSGKSPDPTYFGGLNTAVSFKGIQLGVDFYYSGGNYIYNNQWLVAHDASSVYQNLAVDAADFWTPTHKDAVNPKPDPNKPTYDSDRWLQKGDYIRLRNVTLSYNLPSSLIQKVKMQALQIYVQGQNLWYSAPHYKGDPEVGVGSAESGFTRQGVISLYSYPQSMALTFGVNVTF